MKALQSPTSPCERVGNSLIFSCSWCLWQTIDGDGWFELCSKRAVTASAAEEHSSIKATSVAHLWQRLLYGPLTCPRTITEPAHVSLSTTSGLLTSQRETASRRGRTHWWLWLQTAEGRTSGGNTVMLRDGGTGFSVRSGCWSDRGTVWLWVMQRVDSRFNSVLETHSACFTVSPCWPLASIVAM